MNERRPNKKSIDCGDFLVVSGATEKDPVEMLKVVSVGAGFIVGRSEARMSSRKYADALVLKRDGTYVAGRRVPIAYNYSR